MGRAAIEQLLYLLDEAFQGTGIEETGESQSLIGNLRHLEDGDWLWVPPGRGRSIFSIVKHVGECKYVYDNHAFGDGTMRWDRPETVPSVDEATPKAAILGWLNDGHDRIRAGVASLDDDSELLTHRRANWGRAYETTWLISTLIQHDLYHAGEINHLRALRQGNDT
jgi:hypothetical protein